MVSFSSSSDLITVIAHSMKPILLLFLVSALLLSAAVPTASVTCNPLELSPCSSAVLSGARPSAACCAKLKEQQPCFCQYKKNPSLKDYVNSDNGKKALKACGVPIPSC